MRTRFRAGVIAGVAVALVLSLPTWSSATPADDPGSARARAEQVLAQVGAALAPKEQRSRALGDTLPRADLTLQLRDLRLARPALSTTDRAAADQLLARTAASSGSCSGTVVVTAHFCVRYTAPGLFAGANATTPEQARLTADTLEYVWTREVGTLGFRPPPNDGDGLFDVTLEQLADQGLYGYCQPDSLAAPATSSCVLDNDYAAEEYGAPPLDSLRATAAHEFFHAIQFGYDVLEDLWFMEGSAVWAEEQVYPAINDYLQYLGQSAISRPRTPTDYSGTDSFPDLFHRYGAVLFWTFLSERFGTPAVVRRVWELADATRGSRYSVQAVSAALAERGWSFPRAYGVFGVWNTKPAGSYGDRDLMPAPAWWQVAKLTRGRKGTGTRGVVLNHLTNAAMLLQPGGRLPRDTRLRITVNAPDVARMSRALVQVRKRNGNVVLVPVPLDQRGDGSVRVAFDPRKVRAVVVTLSNASTRFTACGSDRDELYSCGGRSADDGLAFTARARLRLP